MLALTLSIVMELNITTYYPRRKPHLITNEVMSTPVIDGAENSCYISS